MGSQRLVSKFTTNNEVEIVRLDINGAFRGHYQSGAEAMADVEKWARPFGSPWVIFDPFGKIYAES